MSDNMWDWGDEGRPEHQISYAEKMANQAAHQEQLIGELDANYREQQKRIKEFEEEAKVAIANLQSKSDHVVIWIGYMPSAWKTEIKALVGKRISNDDALRTNDIVRVSDFDTWKRISYKDLCILRLTKKQAMMAKLTDRGKLWKMIDDPDGNIWKKLFVSALAIKRDMMSWKHMDEFMVAVQAYYTTTDTRYVIDTDIITARHTNDIAVSYQAERDRLVKIHEHLLKRALVTEEG